MLLQKHDEFLLERARAMVLTLVGDITFRLFNLRDSDAKSGVAFLPGKAVLPGQRVVNPFRRTPFDQLHGTMPPYSTGSCGAHRPMVLT